MTKKLHARNLLIRDSFTDATAVQSDATMTTNYSLEMTRLEARVATELPRVCFTPGRFGNAPSVEPWQEARAVARR